MALRKDGDQLTVLLGRQCRPGSYLTKLLIARMDEKTRDTVSPPLWQIATSEPRAVPEVEIGVLPEGFTAEADNIAAQGVGGRLAITAHFENNTYNTVLDTGKIENGKVLATNERVLTENEFRQEYGCGD
ncbi:hypothetical protein ACVCAH_12665 [Micromonospora sp. LZ34]